MIRKIHGFLCPVVPPNGQPPLNPRVFEPKKTAFFSIKLPQLSPILKKKKKENPYIFSTKSINPPKKEPINAVGWSQVPTAQMALKLSVRFYFDCPLFIPLPTPPPHFSFP